MAAPTACNAKGSNGWFCISSGERHHLSEPRSEYSEGTGADLARSSMVIEVESENEDVKGCAARRQDLIQSSTILSFHAMRRQWIHHHAMHGFHPIDRQCVPGCQIELAADSIHDALRIMIFGEVTSIWKVRLRIESMRKLVYVLQRSFSFSQFLQRYPVESESTSSHC